MLCRKGFSDNQIRDEPSRTETVSYQTLMMKKLVLISLVILAIFAAAQAYVSKDVAKTEQQPYDVLWENDGVEARFYPQAIMATVQSTASEYKNASNQNFRVLAGYIFGGNEEKKSIAMTSPVHMSFNETGSEMSFVMPSKMAEVDLPEPNDRGIKFHQSKEKYVVALRFGGWADDEKIDKNTRLLLKALETMGVEPKSSPWFMGYNPPYQLINRRNEVAVEVSKEAVERIKML
jgi:hypothetical protein